MGTSGADPAAEPVGRIPDGVRFGAAYYTEFQPHERLGIDLDLMVAASIKTIRVGESVSSTWESRDGEFDLGLYIADDALLQLLRDYAESSGHLVLTPRTGYADEEAVARHEVMPGVLREAIGAYYLHFTNLRAPVPVSARDDAGPTGAATAWADELIPDLLDPDGVTVLAGYDHQHLKNFAAITTNTFGVGRVTYVGTVPDRALSASLAAWLADTSLPADPWRSARPDSVTCSSSVTLVGRVVRFVHNWSWSDVEYMPPVATRDLVSGAELAAGKPLRLSSWDVRILLEPTQ